jgi:hypothetical protein
MLQEIKHLKKKIKKLIHSMYEDEPETELKSEFPPLRPKDELPPTPEEPEEPEETNAEPDIPPRRFYSKADLLNYEGFEF